MDAKSLDKEAYNRAVRINKWSAAPEDLLYELVDLEKSYLISFALKHLNINKTTRLLEVGAGKALPANIFNKYTDNVVILDHNDDEIAGTRAAQKIAALTGRKLKAVVADFENLPFEAGTFDVVVARSCLHHACDLKKAVSEIARVLAKGGRLVIFEQCRGSLVSEKFSLRNFYKMPCADGAMNEHAYPPSEWERMLASAGFNVLESKPTYFFPFRSLFLKVKNNAQLTGFAGMFFSFLEAGFMAYARFLGQPPALPQASTNKMLGFEFFEAAFAAVKEK